MFRSTWLRRARRTLHASAPSRNGEDLVRWLVQELQRSGFNDLSGPWSRDWGWRASGLSDGAEVTIQMVLLDGGVHDWIVSAELSDAGAVSDCARRSTTWTRLMLAFELLLVGDQGIFEVHWYR